ncbi:hypothetical protein T439DRAFT_379751 [Meredithblackwellia eburnea MCA 4105]
MPLKASTSAPPLLTPAWTQLSQLPTHDNDEEWEQDQVDYVTLDFARHLPPGAFHRIDELELLGMNLPTPYARLGSQLFRGRHEQLIGTEVILSHSLDGSKEGSPPTYQPFATSKSRIIFNPITLVDTKKKKVTKPEPVIDSDSNSVIKKRGRPKGSKNKKTRTTVDIVTMDRKGKGKAREDTVVEDAESGGASEGTAGDVQEEDRGEADSAVGRIAGPRSKQVSQSEVAAPPVRKRGKKPGHSRHVKGKVGGSGIGIKYDPNELLVIDAPTASASGQGAGSEVEISSGVDDDEEQA